MTFYLTDVCLLTLLSITAILLLWSLRKPPAKKAFKQLLKRPMAACSGLVLVFFLSVGIVDSIHITGSSKTVDAADTLLDVFLSPLGDVYEKTYSEPLALKSFSSEIRINNGVMQQVYPNLKYPHHVFSNEQEKTQWLAHIILKDTLGVFLLMLVIGALWYHRSRPKQSTLFWSVLLTGFILISLVVISYHISRSLHVLGTGKIGQDVFYTTIKSIRTGLVIGLLTTLFMMPLALLLGITAGYFGGLIDDVIQFVYTTLSSIPGVLLITASVLSLQTYMANHPDYFSTMAKSADARLLALCFILGITSWTSLCRVLRAETLKLRELDYIQAAKALGSSHWTIITKHMLPNVMPIVLITLVLDFSFLVLAEAVLSYVGVGVSPTTISWGNMINGARLELAREPVVWWPMFAAFFAMFGLVLASNLFADAVRDVLDPHNV